MALGFLDVMHGICRSEVKTLVQKAVLEDTYAYYSMRSSEWIVHYSLPDYLSKVYIFLIFDESMPLFCGFLTLLIV
jgi:hypothetical protein